MKSTRRRVGTKAGGGREPRLFLSIHDHWYQVERLTHASDRAYRLSKEDGLRYDVTETAYGASCDCPDFIFRRDGLDPQGCKHVRALRMYGLVEPDLNLKSLASGVRGG
ncbi:MAG TPA: hypothetical protein VFT74_07035 [Isosphaeraceae bacterium]|nr:hypothetical protein [Isosphaeraceae bacterium]